MSLFLAWCGSSTAPKEVEKIDPVEIIEEAKVTSWDVQDFNTIVWGSWYNEQEWNVSLFTFKWDNTFAVSNGGVDARWPWIVSEGKILLGESQLELEIVGDNEITIEGVTYLRNEEIN